MTLNRRMATGAAWMMGVRLFNRGVGLVSTIILARLLVPADFGLVMMATAFVGLVASLSTLSVDVPLIQKPDIDRADLDSAWSLQVLFGVAQAAVLGLGALPVAGFYDEPRLQPVLYALAFGILLQGFGNIGVVFFRRNMEFHREFMLIGGQKMIAFMVTVGYAFYARSYWALVLGILASALAGLVLSYAMHSYRPRFSRERWGELFGFSKWLLINNLFYFLNNRAADFILGKVAGARAVGLFSVSYEIAMLPTTEMVAPINRAVLPGYSRMNETQGALARGYLDVAGVVALVALPAAAGIAATAELLVPLLLGAKWLDATPLVQLLAVAGGFSGLLSNTGAAFLAMGRPRSLTILMGMKAMLMLPALYYGASLAGAVGAGWGLITVVLATLPLNLWMILRALSIPLSDYAREVYRPLLAAGLMFGLLHWWAVPGLRGLVGQPLFAAALETVGLGALIYVVCILFLWLLAGRPAGGEAYAMTFAGERLEALSPGLGRVLLAAAASSSRKPA